MNNCSDTKGELLFSIPETVTLADESEEIILGYIVTRKIDYRTVFSTRYVTEQGISEILSWHGAIYDPVVASELLNQKPTHQLKPIQETLIHDGITLHSVSHASRESGYAQKSIRQYLRAGVIPGQKLAGFWYVTDQGLSDLKQRHVEYQPEPVKRPKRKPAPKGMKVEFNNPAGRNVMKYVKRLSELRNFIHDMNIPEPSDEIKMHVEPGTSTVFRKITSDGYVM